MALQNNNPANPVVTYSDLHEETKGLREDFIVIFGLFASVLIFLGVEIQVFQKAPRFSFLVGMSCFMLGAMLAFLFCLHNIAKQKNTWGDYFNNPLTYFIMACFTGAVLCFAWGAFHTANPSSQSTQKTQKEAEPQKIVSNPNVILPQETN
jgi:lysylphosphatidylglycerol synthetase-like protein (DUF2156 family)